MKVLVVSMYPEDQYAIRALRAGAFGYVNKGGDPQAIVNAVRTVAQGRKYVTPLRSRRCWSTASPRRSTSSRTRSCPIASCRRW